MKHRQMSYVTSFFCGLLFAVGLGVSEMTLPTRVLGFLSPLESWDGRLVFVMFGAVFAYAFLYRFALRRRQPLFASTFSWPTKSQIDRPLVVGSILFGLGWGLAGYCPGPAIVASSGGSREAQLFLLSMIGGMGLFLIYEKVRGKA